MKKISLLISLISIGSIQLTAQMSSEWNEKFVFGLKAGINSSNIWDERGDDFVADPKIGFAGGAFFGIPVGRFLGVQPEVLLSQKGFQSSGRVGLIAYNHEVTTTWIDIPILLQLKPVQYVTILAGPQYCFLMNQRDSYDFGGAVVSQEQDFENNNIRKNVFGFGAGLDVNIEHIVVSGRMAWDLQHNKGDGTSTNPRYKNQWLQFTVGYRI